jgi:energy-coupling factor transporter transmembrane protein EcfT
MIPDFESTVNLIFQWLGYAIIFCFTIFPICSFVASIVKRKPLDAFMSLGFMLFAVFMASGFIFGGTPAPEAVTEYELYESGHYYLMSHGDYRDVSYDIYRYMQVMEIVGCISFAISFILALIKNKIETGSFFGKR